MSRYDELVAKHGTYKQFEDATWNALGEISVAEARAALDKYREELSQARLADARDYRAANKIAFPINDDPQTPTGTIVLQIRTAIRELLRDFEIPPPDMMVALATLLVQEEEALSLARSDSSKR